MMRFAGLLLLVGLLPALAWAAGGPSVPAERGGWVAAEALSRAQVAQIIADRGYFEMDGLSQDSHGNWHCAALSGPGKRVLVMVDPHGNISEESPMHAGGQ